MTEPHDRQQLDYEPARRPRSIGAQAVTAAVVASIVFTAVGVGIGGLAALVAVRDIYSWLVVVLGAAVVIGFTAKFSRRAYHDPRRRGWVVGTWIGLGLALLINGLCFVSLMGIGG